MFQLINDEKPDAEDRKIRVFEGGAILAVLAVLSVVLWFTFKYTG